MKKRVLLIGYNFYPEPTGIGKYSGEMMEWLAKNGHDCTVITAYPYYPYWKVQEPYTNRRFIYTSDNQGFDNKGRLVVYRCPMYVPAKPSGVKRVLLDFSFLISALFKLLQLLLIKKFDVVFIVAPSFQFGLLGMLCKQIRGAKFVYHIQDMQIEAARDLQLIKSDKIIKTLLRVERHILDKSDVISTVSEGMVNRIQKKAQKDVFLFPNWADINNFCPLKNRYLLKESFGFKATDKIVLYSGAIGEKQGLEAILYAAKEHESYNNLKFIICGSGPYKQNLQELANNLEIKNLIFLPLQLVEKFNQFLNIADIHLVIQKANAVDFVMPSKLTTILAVGGLALITANKESNLYSLVKEHNIGLLIEAENQQALNAGILEAVLADNNTIITNARTYAENYLSIDGIMRTFEKAVLN